LITDFAAVPDGYRPLTEDSPLGLITSVVMNSVYQLANTFWIIISAQRQINGTKTSKKTDVLTENKITYNEVVGIIIQHTTSTKRLVPALLILLN